MKKYMRLSGRERNNVDKSGKNVFFCLKMSSNCDIINVKFKCCHGIRPLREHFPKGFCAGGKKEREHKMNYLAIEVAKHLIQLYFRSDKRYHCTLTKVEKLLAIAELVYAKNGKRLFYEEITIKACGVGVDGLEFDLPSEIIDTRSTVDRSETGETDTPICPTYGPIDSVPNYFKANPDVVFSEECKKLLLSVFEQFANYKARTLGTQFDGFKHHISYITDDAKQRRCIDQSSVKEFFERECDASLNCNSVYNFIKNYKEL